MELHAPTHLFLSCWGCAKMAWHSSSLRWRDTPLNFVKQLSLHNSKLLWLKKIIWVTGILRRTVAGDWRFDNLCRGHLQSQDVFSTGCWNVSHQTTVLLKTPVTEVIFFNQVYVTPGFKLFSYHDSKFFSISPLLVVSSTEFSYVYQFFWTERLKKD
mgnify:CR=1 FL=1